MKLTKGHSISISRQDLTLTTSLPLYFFMYPDKNATLAIDVSMQNTPYGRGALRMTSNIKVEDATDLDVFHLLLQARTIPCSKCQKPAWDPTSGNTNRDGQCESCFTEAINTEYEKAQAEENAKARKHEIEMFKQGHRHKVTATIHSGSADDSQIIFFSKEPLTKGEIENLLRKHGSLVLTDYITSAITPPNI